MLNVVRTVTLLIAVWFLGSAAILRLGDFLVTKDQFLSAEKFYQVGKGVNPLLDTDKRLLAVSVLTKERNEPSEEIGSPVDIASQIGNNTVLGANVTVPVLMYHYIRINPDKNDKVGFGLSVTPASFTSQMDYLSAHGYHPISLGELGNALLAGGKLPDKPIVITFDDGYRDSYTQAFPVLVKHNFKATNFVITGLVGGPNYLTWEQIQQMKNSGLFTIASHTVHHYALTGLSDSNLLKELMESKSKLEAMLGVKTNWFAYPYGNVDQRVANAVAKTGYVGGFGTNNGTFESSSQMYTLPRVRVSGGESLAFFAQSLPWH